MLELKSYLGLRDMVYSLCYKVYNCYLEKSKEREYVLDVVEACHEDARDNEYPSVEDREYFEEQYKTLTNLLIKGA